MNSENKTQSLVKVQKCLPNAKNAMFYDELLSSKLQPLFLKETQILDFSEKKTMHHRKKTRIKKS